MHRSQRVEGEQVGFGRGAKEYTSVTGIATLGHRRARRPTRQVAPRARPTGRPARVIDLAVVRRRRTIDNWFVALVIASSTMFAGAMAVYVFFPTVATVAGPSVVAWNNQGP